MKIQKNNELQKSKEEAINRTEYNPKFEVSFTSKDALLQTMTRMIESQNQMAEAFDRDVQEYHRKRQELEKQKSEKLKEVVRMLQQINDSVRENKKRRSDLVEEIEQLPQVIKEMEDIQCLKQLKTLLPTK